MDHLHCHRCGKRVSTGFTPEPTDTPDQGLIVRAWIECPECIEVTQGWEAVAKEWAASDHLWTTQETVERSLLLFARVVLTLNAQSTDDQSPS